mmetsp:Transcript_2477/g.6679  ORF Transcript_2477/g.6679 Transcript_2477/m.6679 type:complete len:224 (+) Transcript_2477:82-753(+)
MRRALQGGERERRLDTLHVVVFPSWLAFSAAALSALVKAASQACRMGAMRGLASCLAAGSMADRAWEICSYKSTSALLMRCTLASLCGLVSGKEAQKCLRSSLTAWDMPRSCAMVAASTDWPPVVALLSILFRFWTRRFRFASSTRIFRSSSASVSGHLASAEASSLTRALASARSEPPPAPMAPGPCDGAAAGAPLPPTLSCARTCSASYPSWLGLTRSSSI